MTDKLYNGFREGRTPGNHKVNNQVREMTKEQILNKQPSIPGNLNDVLIEHGDCLEAMEEYAQEELAKERERAGKLVEALKRISWYLDGIGVYESVGYITKTLNEYNGTES